MERNPVPHHVGAPTASPGHAGILTRIMPPYSPRNVEQNQTQWTMLIVQSMIPAGR